MHRSTRKEDKRRLGARRSDLAARAVAVAALVVLAVALTGCQAPDTIMVKAGSGVDACSAATAARRSTPASAVSRRSQPTTTATCS